MVSDGRFVRGDVERAGDEAMVLASRASGVPVLVGADRLRVGHQARALFDTEILVLDDGFQHHALDRDFDLVCIDAIAGIGNGRGLPAGPLREPLSALRYADALCWLGVEATGEATEPPEKIVRAFGEGRPIHGGTRRALDCVPLGGGASSSPDALAGVRVGLVSGLARPAGFRHLVEGLGADVAREIRFPDHHVYTASDLAALRDREGAALRWLTTEKDAFKILPEWVTPARVDVLRIEARIERSEGLLDGIEARLVARGRLG